MTKDVILCLETSTTNCSVGVIRGSEILSVKEVNEGYSHAEELAPLVLDVLADSGLDYNDLGAVAIGKGPGSYTGLRIGTAFAKGFCYSQKIPLIALNSLQIMAGQIKRSRDLDPTGFLIPMLDARRMEVYTSVYDLDLKELSPTRAAILNSDSFNDFPGVKYLFGPGALKFFDSGFDTDDCYHLEGVFPGVEGMAELVSGRISIEDFEDLAYFEPFYLKDFVAGRPRELL